MISLNKYLLDSFDKKLILSEEDKAKLIELDREYNDLVSLKRKGFNEKDVRNLKEEMNKFFEARKRGEKYFPILDLGECEYDTDGIIDKANALLTKFINFPQCFLSGYYIACIERILGWCKFYIDKKNGIPRKWTNCTISPSTYYKALETLKNSTFESDGQLDRNIDSDGAAEMVEKALDELGYEWKVSLEPNMIARMNVLPNGIIRISKTAKFNSADIEGLIAHEIKGHIGRRVWGKKTGLYIFVHGLRGRSTLDEGLAVWNSINLVNTKKPNVMFNIALKCVIAYLKFRMDFCDLFDFIKNLHIKGNPSDEVIFKSIVRAKRENIDTSLLGGVSDDSDYFIGYNMVKNMTDKQREDILKYNVGPIQLKDIPKIKKFFKLNKFEPI